MAALHRTMIFDPYGGRPEPAAEAFAMRHGGRGISPMSSSPARAGSASRRASSAAIVPRRAGGEAGAHAWAEAHVPRLGWVAFDPAIGLCADARYVRVVGFDGQDGAFVRSAHGGSEEAVETAIQVEQAGVQSQA